MLAHITGLKPANFVHTLGDAYIYLNHGRLLKTLKMLLKLETIDDLKAEGFQIEGYDPHPTIKMEMAA